MVKRKLQKLDLKQSFLGLQKEMAMKLGNARLNIGHPVAKGDVTENSWRGMLGTYLPRRYAVEKAFIVDSAGNMSDQIDLVIFDRHFSPFLLHQDGALFIPAESVYAVFEIKQEITAKEVAYAGDKVASVRRLRRTSNYITHAGGQFKPVKPKEIIGGILCLKSRLRNGLAGSLVPSLNSLSPLKRLDLACILEEGAVSLTPGKRMTLSAEVFPAEQALIQFFLALLIKLQIVGSVPAMDIGAYRTSLLIPQKTSSDKVNKRTL